MNGDGNDQQPPNQGESPAGGETPAAGETASKQAAADEAAKTNAKKKRATKKKAGPSASDKKKAKATKKKATKRRKPASVPSLPAKSLVLTDENGQAAGVLPKHALVMVRQAIIRDPAGRAVGIDPRPVEKAFLWLLGRHGGQGLDPSAPHERRALKLVEQLVRASVVGDEPGRELIDRWHGELLGGAGAGSTPDRAPPAPLSSSDLALATKPDVPSEE